MLDTRKRLYLRLQPRGLQEAQITWTWSKNTKIWVGKIAKGWHRSLRVALTWFRGGSVTRNSLAGGTKGPETLDNSGSSITRVALEALWVAPGLIIPRWQTPSSRGLSHAPLPSTTKRASNEKGGRPHGLIYTPTRALLRAEKSCSPEMSGEKTSRR